MRERLLIVLVCLLFFSSCGSSEERAITVPTIAVTEEQIRMQKNLAYWYNTNLRSEQPDVGFERSYNSILFFENGVAGYVEIPGTGVYPIYHSARETGFYMDRYSAFPVGGAGNQFKLYCGEALTLKKGDMIYMHILGDVLAYRVGEQGNDSCILFCGRETYHAARMVED